ncbi:NaeI family type II restriction endonuclease [Pseudosulfitobacter sp. DSM 107133]|uniref:NaeI family type II restriction endonuclease n=1 Tax=Pseudosulfitobacter sp. DSM 107133 TaxID=2883100 RepID=UPI000DF1164B|nr:NaeI family type II restriction endonuclease [Pseudosulfitobacter sp. DSM 107133]UOA27741.1 Type-2 restriction enzyme NaeI [Pseudosulfitobacter sp. DSM 107133]
MKQSLPDSIVTPDHRDHALLSTIAADITARAGGPETLATQFAAMLRRCVDDVIMTPKTGRRSYEELEKTEKTYIGTRVEIELRAMLRLQRGKLDTVVQGHDVDIKNTMGSNWMIPTEAIDHPCILVAADEVRAQCYLGLIVARPDYLTAGQNKDAKKSVSAQGFANILWLLRHHPYPANFWRTVPPEIVPQIFAGASGNQRMAALFRHIQGKPITRDVVEAVAQQQDFMRRIRSDKGRGTRDLLAREGIALLSGHYDAPLIAALGLPHCTGSEFVSYRPVTREQVDLAAVHGVVLDL